MKRFFLRLLILFMVQLTFAGILVTVDLLLPRVAPRKWEYRTYYLRTRSDGQLYGADLKKLGQEGWELVQVVPVQNQTQVCYFKRPQGFSNSEAEEEKENKAAKE